MGAEPSSRLCVIKKTGHLISDKCFIVVQKMPVPQISFPINLYWSVTPAIFAVILDVVFFFSRV